MTEFWKAAGIRALRTICQTAVATIGTAIAVTEVDWLYVLSASLLAGILSLLTSISTGLPEVQLVDTLYALDNNTEEEDDDEEEYEDEEFFVDEEIDEEGDM